MKQCEEEIKDSGKGILWHIAGYVWAGVAQSV
jgi:hypothetical protein